MTAQEESFAGVRIAQPGDEDAIFNILLQLYEENALFTLDEMKARETIRFATEKRGGIIGVIDGAGGLEATIGMALESYWYTSQWHLVEYWNHIHKDHRQSSHAKRMIEFAKWAADRLGVPLIMGILTTDRLAPKVRLYQRQLPQIGAIFSHGLSLTNTYAQRKAARKNKDKNSHKDIVQWT